MNKFLLASLVVAPLLLAGCNKTSTPSTAEPTGTTEGGALSDKMKGWADAVNVGGGLKCTFTNTKTNTVSQYVAKSKKMHMKGFAMGTDQSATTGEMISDSAYMYTWDSAKKEGFKMALPSEEELKESADKANELQKNAPVTPDFTSEESVKKLEDEGTKMDCSPAIVSDAEFVPPTDVKFQDFSTMMQDSLKKAQEGMTDEEKKQLEDAMKQYKDQ